MKIYGNARSDGFSLFVVLIGALFVGGGFLLAHVGELTIIASLLAFAGLCAAMVAVVRKWDVMSDVGAPGDAKQADDGVPVRLPNFPVKADTEAVATSSSPLNNVASLPVVDKPKTAIETNTQVAA